MKPRHVAGLALVRLGFVLLGAAAGVGATYFYFNRTLHQIEERQREPLKLRTVDLLNTDKHGTALGGPTTTFDRSTVKFVESRITFDNRLYGLATMPHRVEAVYNSPDNQSFRVYDSQTVSRNQKTVTFTDRVGNPSGGAFKPGTYVVELLLDGERIGQRAFVVAAPGVAEALVTVPPGNVGPVASQSSTAIAAVTSVGWYLVVPPWSKHNDHVVPDVGAPLSAWSMWGSYDSAAECRREQAAEQVSYEAKLSKLTPQPHNLFREPVPPKEEILYISIAAALCVATDDPRLTEAR